MALPRVESNISKINNNSNHRKKNLLAKIGFFSSISLFIVYFSVSFLLEGSILSFPYKFNSSYTTKESLNLLPSDSVHSQEYELLNDTWTSIYGLNLTSEEIKSIEIQSILYNATVPPAPHLQNCPLLLNEVSNFEKYDAKIGYPNWALDSAGPMPPWIRGSDEDNLPLTRLAQRDVWINQHPLNCKSNNVKFAMANWTTTIGHGIGSQLHVMAMLFSVALAANRVFVPYPHSFQRANVSSCQGRSHLSLDCYFAPLLPRECMFKAMKYFNSKDKKAKKIVWIADRLHLATVLNAEEPLIYLHHYPWKLFLSLHDFPKAMEWPKYKVPSPLNKVMIKNGGKMPWLYANSYMEIEKKDFHLSDAAKMKMWMLSQVVRYMLRWPSLHLCHAMNIERHNVYGRHVIDRVVRTSHMQSNADVDDKLRGFGGFEAKHWVRSEPQFLRNIMDEPYMPRPIVSVHVRQGDKAIEMKLFSFSSHMYFVHKHRYHEPNLKYVWLSTEMQYHSSKGKEFRSITSSLESNRVGDLTDLTILCEGEKVNAKVKLGLFTRLVPVHINNLPPSYFLIAGIVFTPLTVPFLRSEYGKEYDLQALISVLNAFQNKMAELENGQRIVVSQWQSQRRG